MSFNCSKRTWIVEGTKLARIDEFYVVVALVRKAQVLTG